MRKLVKIVALVCFLSTNVFALSNTTAAPVKSASEQRFDQLKQFFRTELMKKYGASTEYKISEMSKKINSDNINLVEAEIAKMSDEEKYVLFEAVKIKLEQSDAIYQNCGGIGFVHFAILSSLASVFVVAGTEMGAGGAEQFGKAALATIGTGAITSITCFILTHNDRAYNEILKSTQADADFFLNQLTRKQFYPTTKVQLKN